MIHECAPRMMAGEQPSREIAPEPGMAELVLAARDGDREAGDRLWNRVRPRLLRIALALGADPGSADDTVQESLWAAHRGLARYDPSRGGFMSWLVTILVRRLKNRRRADSRSARLREALRAVVPRRAHPGQEAVDARMTLRRLLERLTPRQREVVALYEIGGLESGEVARVLGLSPAGVRSMARDARERLSAGVRAKEADDERRS